MEDNFYIYIYLDPRKSGQYNYGSYEFEYEPFYVGKGQGNRINVKKSDHCENKINKIKRLGFETIRIKLKENLEENYSFELEEELIKLIGKEILNEGPLTNIADGGEGVSGYKWTEEELKKRRKEYTEIKNTFETIKYTLKTEEKDYENNRQKLEYICDRGHEHSITWSSFQQGKRCPYCVGNKIYFSEIKNTFEKIKYELKTEEKDYTNNRQKLEYICDKGHEHSITWANFQQEHKCPYCVGKKIDFSEIKNAFEKIKYTLKTEEKDYINSKQKLEYICDKGHEHSITWNDFQQGSRCSYCVGCKIDFSEIKNEFEDIRECELITEEKDYINSKQKLEYICPNGHEHSISWNNFQQRKNNYCPKCNRMERDSINKIRRSKICLLEKI